MHPRPLLRLALVGWCSLLLLPTLARADDEPKKAAAVIPRSLTELEAEIRKVLEKTKTPGLAITLVSRDEGELWTSGLGLADVAAKRPATAETPFRIGSISKTFVGLAALTLVEEGRLSLDDTLRSRAPEVWFENPWEETDPVRIVHLLEHTAGFDDLRLTEYALSDPDIPLLAALNYFPASRVARWRPGTRFSYCNSGPAIVAHIIAKITGQRFEDYVAERFFAPLGMTTASFFLDPATAKTLTQLYQPDGVTPYPYWHIGMRPAGSINASARDMAHYLRLFLGRGTVEGHTFLRPESIARMERPTTTWAARAGLTTGYGLNNYTLLARGFTFHGHNGGVEGGLAVMNYLPREGVGYAFMINSGSTEAFRAVARLVQAYLTRELTPPPAPAIATVPAAIAERFSGYYRPDSPRQEFLRGLEGLLGTVHVEVGEKGLRARPFLGKATEARSVSERSFRAAATDDDAEEGEATMVLIDDPEEGLLIQSDNGTLSRISGIRAWGWRLAALFCALAMLSALPFALIWGPRWLFRRLSGWPTILMRAVPLAAVLCLLALPVILFLCSDELIARLGHLTFWSASFFVATLAFASGSLAGPWFAFRAWKAGANRWALAHSLAVSLANLIAAGTLASWGWIGLRLWR